MTNVLKFPTKQPVVRIWLDDQPEPVLRYACAGGCGTLVEGEAQMCLTCAAREVAS